MQNKLDQTSIALAKTKRRSLSINGALYLLLLPSIIYLLVFAYLPIYGITIAFKDFSANAGILGSPWVGLKHFRRFFELYTSKQLIVNTIMISLYSLVAGFPIPIIFALFLNQMRHKRYKKLVQTVSYAPHFISTVVIVGILQVFLSQNNGIINIMIKSFNMQPVNFLGKANLFRDIYVWSGVWQNFGWASIIYLSALSSINPELYEAARIDGASKLRCILHIDLPGILPTATILLILNSGNIMKVGFEKAFLMQNNLNITQSEIISTFVYKVGLLGAQFSFSTAIDLFNSIICALMLILVNTVSRRLSENSLW